MQGPVFLFRAREHRFQRRQHVAGKECSDRIAGLFDMGVDLRLGRRFAVGSLELLAQVLRRQDSVVEVGRHVTEIVRYAEFIGFAGLAANEHRNRIALVLAGLRGRRWRHCHPPRSRQAYRDNLVFGAEGRAYLKRIAAAPQGKITPGEFLDRPDAGVLLFPIRIGLGVEGDPCRQQPTFAGVQIDAGDHEAEAVFDLAVGFPGKIGDFIITKSAGFNYFGHGYLPIDFLRGRCAWCLSAD